MRALSRLLPLPIIVAAFLLIVFPAWAQPASDPMQERAVIAAINAWRLQLGLPPFQANPTLMRMALAQAQHVMSLPQIPAGGDIHIDANGGDPRTRAVNPPYNWPFYGDRFRVNLTEIAAAQPNATRAVGWWQNSALHTRSVSNASYREIGAAALRTRNGFLYIVVLGSRPNVLTAFPDPRGNTLYLTTEGFSGGTGNWLRSANEFRVRDAGGRILSDWQTWRAQVPLASDIAGSLNVDYRSGAQEVSTSTSLNPADVLLPQYADVWSATSPGEVVIAAQPTAVPIMTNTPAGAAFIGFATNTPFLSASIPTPTPFSLPTQVPPTLAPPTAIPPTAIPPSPTPLNLLYGGIITPSPRSVTLIYTTQTLTIIPNSPGVDITRVAITDGARTVRFGNLNGQFLRGTLNALGQRDCVLITVNRSLVSAPAGCVFVSTTFLTPDRALWQVDFTAIINDQPAIFCRAGDQRCFINLP
jgi:hypothetical protein